MNTRSSTAEKAPSKTRIKLNVKPPEKPLPDDPQTALFKTFKAPPKAPPKSLSKAPSKAPPKAPPKAPFKASAKPKKQTKKSRKPASNANYFAPLAIDDDDDDDDDLFINIKIKKISD